MTNTLRATHLRAGRMLVRSAVITGILGLAGNILGLAGSVGAQNFYWDGIDGSWGTASLWSLDPDNPTPNPDAFPAGKDVFFNISSGNGDTLIDLNGNRVADSLNFTNTGQTAFRGNSAGTTARTLTIGPRGITVAPGAGRVTIGSGNGAVNLTFTSSQSITNDSSSQLSINNNVAGSGSPTLTNNGTGSGAVALGVLQGSVGKVVQDSATSTLFMRANNTAFTGDLEILKGTVFIGTQANNLGSATAGKVILGGSGTDAATIEINDNSNTTYNARPIVLGTTTGLLSIVLRDNRNGLFTHTITGAISGPNNLTLENRADGVNNDDRFVFTTGGINNAGTITHIGDGAGDLTISSVIGPLVTGVIQNSATSRMVLTGENTYAGNTTVSAGALVITTPAALPGFDTPGRYSVATGAALSVVNAVTDADVAAILATDNFASGGAIGFDTAAGDREYAAAIADTTTGGLGLVKQGANTLTLSGVNTYTGTTRVDEGALLIASTAALPGWDTPGRYSVAPGAALAVVNAVTDADVATILGTGNIGAGGAIGFDTTAGDRTYAAVITDPPRGGLGLFKLGGNTLTLAVPNTFTGPTRSVAGTLAVADALALGSTTLDMAAADSGAVTFSQDSTLGGLAGSRDLDLGGRSISVGTNNQSTAYSGNISNGSLTKIGTGVLTLSGTNTYAAGTTVLEGTLAIARAAALPGFDTPGRYSVSFPAALSVGTGVTDSEVSAILASGNIAAGGDIAFDTTAGDRTAPAIFGDIGLRKTGANTLSLAEAGNTYSGATNVAAGTLRIPGTQTIASNVRVEAGAQIHLDGDVTMTGPVRWQGGDGVWAVSGTSEISGPMSLGNINGNVLRVSEGAQLTIGGDITAEGTNSRFYVTGTGTLIVTGNIGELNTANAGGLFENPTVYLLGLNQFTGQFNAGVGTLVVNTLFNTGFESSLGTGTGPNGRIINMTSAGGAVEATLRYIGEETSTNRQVRFMSNTAGGRNVIEASGTGQLRFSSDVFNVTLSRPPQNLVLSGTNTGVIEGRIQDNTGGGVISLIKEGTGTWVLRDPTSYTGPTTITAGTLRVAAPRALERTASVTVNTGGTLEIEDGVTLPTASIIVDGGTLSASTLAVNDTTGIRSLAINAGTIAGSPAVAIAGGRTMSLSQDARVTVEVGSLSVNEADTGGRLDLGVGLVSIAAGGITPDDLRANIIAGRAGGSWDGASGIMSSAAPTFGETSGFAVGYRVAGDTSATVAWASLGDADLDGAVTTADVNAILTSGLLNTGISGAIWQQGDFDYDGLLTTADINALLTTGRLNTGSYLPAAPPTSSLSAVPEPGTAGLTAAALGVLAASGWRRVRRATGRGFRAGEERVSAHYSPVNSRSAGGTILG
jgi:fibronectin-binding autotransporter adhesin